MEGCRKSSGNDVIHPTKVLVMFWEFNSQEDCVPAHVTDPLRVYGDHLTLSLLHKEKLATADYGPDI